MRLNTEKWVGMSVSIVLGNFLHPTEHIVFMKAGESIMASP